MNFNTLLLLLFSGQMYCASLGNSLEVNITEIHEELEIKTGEEETISTEDFELLIDSDETVPDKNGGRMVNNKTRSGGSDVVGCPSKIPIISDGRIVAGRKYSGKGNDLPQLACNGGFFGEQYAETKFTHVSPYFTGIGSLIVNPGCTFYAFPEYDFGGVATPFPAGTYPNPKVQGPVVGCSSGPCVRSHLWTCIQTYPSCTPSDSWQTIAQLDNSASTVAAKLIYKKTVGTEYSQDIKDSKSVSTEVSASISAAFWGITATIGAKSTTGYDWSKTDTDTKSEATTMSVEIMLPAGANIWIEEAQGTCGGSTIHTQMFRVIDKITGKRAKAIENKKLGKIIVL